MLRTILVSFLIFATKRIQTKGKKGEDKLHTLRRKSTFLVAHPNVTRVGTKKYSAFGITSLYSPHFTHYFLEILVHIY